MITLNIKKELTDEEIDEILCTAIEGGIGYWACLRNDLDEWVNARHKCIELYGKDNVFYSTVAKYILEHNGTITFEDTEDDSEIWELTQEKFIHGCELYELKYGSIHKAIDHSDFDANDADAIIQLSLFNEIVFG